MNYIKILISMIKMVFLDSKSTFIVNKIVINRLYNSSLKRIM